jgi:hypothetical protein
MFGELAERLKDVLINPKTVGKHYKEEMIKANMRLNELELNSDSEMSQAYREGFVQGWIEKSLRTEE